MFSTIRRHFSYTNVALTLALVFAMSGGAYAASKYLITSTKQISPKVLKALAGKTGPAGKNGSAGAPGPGGPPGPAGPGGPAGGPGTKGETGATGKEGAAGKEGTAGKEGSPWTAKGTLPTGSTETGEWAVQGTAAATEELKTTAISFPIPLAIEPVEAVYVKIGQALQEGCKGNAVTPGAESRHLCVFEAEGFGVHRGGLEFALVTNPQGSSALPGTTGGELVFSTTKTGEVSAEGSWAVTG